MKINWKKVGRIALAAGAEFIPFRGMSWIRVAIKLGQQALDGGDRSVEDVVEGLIAKAHEFESDQSMPNQYKRDALVLELRKVAGPLRLKERQLNFAVDALLMAAKGELSLDQMIALLAEPSKADEKADEKAEEEAREKEEAAELANQAAQEKAEKGEARKAEADAKQAAKKDSAGKPG